MRAFLQFATLGSFFGGAYFIFWNKDGLYLAGCAVLFVIFGACLVVDLLTHD